MAKAKAKYYVVWLGRSTGIFLNWKDCQAAIEGFPGAKYKSFNTQKEAELAFANGPDGYWGKSNSLKPKQTSLQDNLIGEPIFPSIVVDGAWNTKTGDIEYQGVLLGDRMKLFKQGPYKDGTNNIAEFLALVHALAICKQKKIDCPIYSDSKTAISWVKAKTAKTTLVSTDNNKELFNLIQRAEEWLKNNSYSNKILKWETEIWGENPADFGRK